MASFLSMGAGLVESGNVRISHPSARGQALLSPAGYGRSLRKVCEEKREFIFWVVNKRAERDIRDMWARLYTGVKRLERHGQLERTSFSCQEGRSGHHLVVRLGEEALIGHSTFIFLDQGEIRASWVI